MLSLAGASVYNGTVITVKSSDWKKKTQLRRTVFFCAHLNTVAFTYTSKGVIDGMDCLKMMVIGSHPARDHKAFFFQDKSMEVNN